jgi:outer membrane murein-binding lipoprotein Lpp
MRSLDKMTAPHSPHEARMDQLQQQAETLAASISKLDAEFEAFATEFHGSNSAAALKRADQIEREQASLRREAALNRIA